jgi:hypothetical protein
LDLQPTNGGEKEVIKNRIESNQGKGKPARNRRGAKSTAESRKERSGKRDGGEGSVSFKLERRVQHKRKG